MIREVLRMGDPRLWQKSLPVAQFNATELHQLLEDMRDTMAHLNGAGLAAPQIGVQLRVVIFGVKSNPRYPGIDDVPRSDSGDTWMQELNTTAYVYRRAEGTDTFEPV